jgi:hypothetical protein
MTITVTVWDKQYDVRVEQRSASVWIAVGECYGETIRVQGRSPRAAASAWRDAAQYRNN